jgi:hypothetical protein
MGDHTLAAILDDFWRQCNKEQGSVIRHKEGVARNEEVPTSTTLKGYYVKCNLKHR